jgi:ATP-binding cassette subfamily F protein 3
MAGQRIGILGANGQGKSTLVKTIARDLTAISGEVTEGKGLNIGYFAQQELDVLRPQDTPLEHMVRLAKEAIAAGRSNVPGASRNCAISSAPSISAATWSSRRSAP